jgi:hypothetical protein
MGDVAEQPIGNAKTTFSSDVANQGQQKKKKKRHKSG